MSNEYREGDSDDPVRGRPKTEEWIQQGAGNPTTLPEPNSEADPGNNKAPENAPGIGGKQVYTAVLLVQTHDGVVVPITNLGGMVDAHHSANPHEVLRMVEDIADQIRSMRLIGEITRVIHQQVDSGVRKHNEGQLIAMMSGTRQYLAPIYDKLGVKAPTLKNTDDQ